MTTIIQKCEMKDCGTVNENPEKYPLNAVRLEDDLDNISDSESTHMKINLVSKTNITTDSEEKENSPVDQIQIGEHEVIEVVECVESDESGESCEEFEISENISIKDLEAFPSKIKLDENSVAETSVEDLFESKPDPALLPEETNNLEDPRPHKNNNCSTIIKNNDTFIQTAQPIIKPTTNEKQTDIENLTEVTESIKLSYQQVKSDVADRIPECALVSNSLSVETTVPQNELPLDASKLKDQQQKQSEEIGYIETSQQAFDSGNIPKNNKDNINNTLKEIILDIDRVIEQEVDQQEQEQQCVLQQKQKAAADEKHRLINAKQGSVPQIQLQQNLNQPQMLSMVQNVLHQQSPLLLKEQHTKISRKYVTNEESPCETGYVKKNQTNDIEESPTVSQKVDLQKIFTPATDSEEILPKNRKLYASSAFYSPNFHPTVEDQVALARRISNSLSDISNHQSKGQSMYVNRKKRSVKWVHEGSGKGQPEIQEYYEESKENKYNSRNDYNEKVTLRLVMNPRGQVRDLNSVREPISETGLLSPDRCAELVTALNAPKGRGAELFAKRRRKSEKWIVNDSGPDFQLGLLDNQQLHKSTSSASIVPAYSDIGIQIHDKYSQSSSKIVKSPWEAALETGSASKAFEEVNKHVQQFPHYGQYEHQRTPQISVTPIHLQEQVSPFTQSKSLVTNSQRDLAYKPNIPQGWKTPAVILPKELYVPKEIPLKSYAPPPETSNYVPSGAFPVYQYSSCVQVPNDNKSHSGFPFTKPGTNIQPQSPYPISRWNQLEKQQSWIPSVYQQPSSSNHPTPVNFNPSPLPFNKLAKFEQLNPSPTLSYPQRSLDVLSTPKKQGNISPTIFGSGAMKTVSKPIYLTEGSPVDQWTRSSSTSPVSPRPLTQQFPRVSSVDLSHCQNFNVSARGWGGAKKNEPYRPILVGPKVVRNLHYSDF